jgi:hypothetical protein
MIQQQYKPGHDRNVRRFDSAGHFQKTHGLTHRKIQSDREKSDEDDDEQTLEEVFVLPASCLARTPRGRENRVPGANKRL